MSPSTLGIVASGVSLGGPPTLAASGSTAYSNTTSPKTSAVTPANGDVFVLVIETEDNSTTLGTPTGGGWTYTLQQQVTVAAFTSVAIYTFLPTNSTGFSISCTTTFGTGWWGFTWLRFTGSAGVGASSKTNNASGAPSLGLTTSFANSAIVCGIGDWSNQAGAQTWRTVNGITPTAGNGGERLYSFQASHYVSSVAYWSDAGAAGAKTVGETAPTGQKYSIAAVEVRGT